MKLPKLRLAIAVAGVLAACAAGRAQVQSTAGAGPSLAATAWGAANSGAMSAAMGGTVSAGQGTADASSAGPARAADAGASKWTAGASSFSQGSSGGWTVGKGSFSASRGAAWSAEGQGFGEQVQRGGVWRVDPSLSPAGAVGFAATSLTGGGNSANPAELSETPAEAPAPVLLAAPAGGTGGRAHGYGHSGVHHAAGLHRAATGSPGRTHATHAVSHRSAGFARSAGGADAGSAQGHPGLPGDLNTPSLMDPALSNSRLSDSGPQDSLGSGLPQ